MPRNTYNKTPAQMAAALAAEADLIDGVYTWRSSGNPVPNDYAEIAGVSGAALAAHVAGAQRHLDRVLAEYRAARANQRPSAEEAFEMRAAFGPGVTVRDLITGQEFTT